MPRCLEYLHERVNANGETIVRFRDNLTNIEDCSAQGYDVLLTSAQYDQLLLSDSILNNLFNPNYLTTAQLQELFVFGFSLPLIVFLVAWAYQTVINFATQD